MAQQDDACTLLDEDHNQVIRLFEQYKAAHNDNDKRMLAGQICQELTVHAQIEEEIFYPAFARAVGNQDLLADATQEHDEARTLIATIENAPRPDDKVMLALEDAILHHVNDEREKMFAQARKAKGMDLVQLAGQLVRRKAELMAGHPA